MFLRKHSFLLLLLVCLSCSSFNKKNYNWGMYGGSLDHCPYSEIELPIFLHEKIENLPFNIIRIFPDNNNLILITDEGQIMEYNFNTVNYVPIYDFNNDLSSAVKFNNLIFLTFFNGKAICYSLDDEMVLWEKKLNRNIFSTPFVEGEKFVLTTLENLYIFNSLTGDLITQIENISSMGCGSLSPIVEKDRIFICDNRGNIRCFNIKDGSLLWQYQSDCFFPIRTTPAIYKDDLYVHLLSGEILILDKEKGILKDKIQLPSNPDFSYIAIDSDILFVSTFGRNKYFLMYSLKEKKYLWTRNDIGGYFFLFKNSILIEDSNRILQIDRDGSERRTYNFQTNFLSTVFIDNKLISGGNGVIGQWK